MARSILRDLIVETILSEEVYGKLSFVYTGSRSPPDKFLSLLAEDQLNPGEEGGSLYGAALYTVYDLAGTNTESGTYGDYIYKLDLNLDGFISFDADIAEKIYGDPLTPVDQAKSLRLDREIVDMLSSVMSQNRDMEYTSDAADPASRFLKGTVKGIVFTGRDDGKVVVVYDANAVRPVAYRTVNDSSWTKISNSDMARFVDRTTGAWKPEKYEPNPVLTKKKMMRLYQQYRVMGSSMPRANRIYDGDLDLSDIDFDQLIPGLHVKGSMKMGPGARELPEGLKVDGDLLIYSTDIRSLPRGLEVGGDLRTPLHLKHVKYPFKVSGELNMQMSGVSSIPAGTIISGDCIMEMSLIKTLPAGFAVAGNLYLSHTEIETLPAGLRVGGDIYLTGSKVRKIPDDALIGGKVVGLASP